MTALLGLFNRTGQQSYLDEALKIGAFIETFRIDTGTYQGFLWGYDTGAETATPHTTAYASTEHTWTKTRRLPLCSKSPVTSDGKMMLRTPELSSRRCGTVLPSPRTTI